MYVGRREIFVVSLMSKLSMTCARQLNDIVADVDDGQSVNKEVRPRCNFFFMKSNYQKSFQS